MLSYYIVVFSSDNAFFFVFFLKHFFPWIFLTIHLFFSFFYNWGIRASSRVPRLNSRSFFSYFVSNVYIFFLFFITRVFGSAYAHPGPTFFTFFSSLFSHLYILLLQCFPLHFFYRAPFFWFIFDIWGVQESSRAPRLIFGPIFFIFYPHVYIFFIFW